MRIFDYDKRPCRRELLLVPDPWVRVPDSQRQSIKSRVDSRAVAYSVDWSRQGLADVRRGAGTGEYWLRPSSSGWLFRKCLHASSLVRVLSFFGACTAGFSLGFGC
jgi:hypothetical protein